MKFNCRSNIIQTKRKDYADEFGNSEKRKELGFTQEQVAKYLNVSIPAVSKWEKGPVTLM